MSFGADHPLCPICRGRMVQGIPGTGGWACITHGDFVANAGTPASATVASAGDPDGGSHVPGDVLTVVGGRQADGDSAATFDVATTKVIRATVVGAGSGGDDGVGTVVGTTGTGTMFSLSVTVSGGEIAAIDEIAVAGSYSVNPTDVTVEPVTGAGLTGATVALVMGVETVAFDATDDYTSEPTDPAATTSDGAGSGCTLHVFCDRVSITLGTDIQAVAESASGATAGDLVVGL